MAVPLLDLQAQYATLAGELDEAVLGVVRAQRFILGPTVEKFEQEAARYLGVKHAIGCASGTDALLLPLRALQLEPGDEVIVPAFTFFATAGAVWNAGLRPVFADIDPATFNMRAEDVERALTHRTRAIIPVHLYGQVAEMEPIMELAEKRGLTVIEDAAQAFGARRRVRGEWRYAGTLGHVGSFSFFPSKNLGCYGDGGMVTTNSAELAEQVRVLRNHGSKVRYHHSVIGYNSRLDEIQAVILRAKLKHIAAYNEGRRRVAHRYSAQLDGSVVTPPHEDGKGVHVYHQYTVLTDSRDAIMAALSAQQIASAIYYPIPLHRQEVFAAGYADVSLPVTEAVAASCMSLPIFPEMTDAQVDEVVRVIKSAL